MKLTNTDIIKQMLLNSQEGVRDFQEYSRKFQNEEIRETFKKFAEDEAMHAKKLQELLSDNKLD